MVTISQQPEANAVLPAYLPIVFKCTADNDPAVVYCDVYFNLEYHRTYFATKKEGDEYVFDIQDAVQEKLTHNVPEIGGSKIIIDPAPLGKVSVKFRNSITVNGIVKSEQPEPTAATNETGAISGGGVASNVFYALNAVVQHEESKILTELLNTYKTGTWDADSYPLTKKPKTVEIGMQQSSYFPILTDKSIAKLKCYAMFRGSTTYNVYEKTIDAVTDVVEISNPPTVNIKWLTGTTEDTNDHHWDLKNGPRSKKIKVYPDDPDLDIVSVKIYKKTGSGNFEFLGDVTSNVYIISSLVVGVHQFKVIATDSKNNTGESNILNYNVVDTTPVPGTINLTPGDNISVIGGTYVSSLLQNGDYQTIYNINFLTAIADFYEAKAMVASELRIKFGNLIIMDSWRYNNTVVTDTNYTATEVQPSQINFFDGNSQFQGLGTVQIIHEFQIYHIADPLQIFTNYLEMEFS